MFVFVELLYIYKERKSISLLFVLFFAIIHYPFLCSFFFLLFIICRLFINLHVNILVLIGFRIHTYPIRFAK